MTMPLVKGATITRVATSTAAVNLLTGGTRSGFCVFNESAAIAYLKFGPGASATDYTVQLPATTGYYESPVDIQYQAIVSLALAAGAGFAQVTSLDGD